MKQRCFRVLDRKRAIARPLAIARSRARDVLVVVAANTYLASAGPGLGWSSILTSSVLPSAGRTAVQRVAYGALGVNLTISPKLAKYVVMS